MEPVALSVKRPGLWIGPAFLLGLSLVVLAAAPEVGTRVFYTVFAAGSGYWLFRATHIRVDLDDEGVSVRGQVRTRRIPWKDISRATTAPMRTKSPFARQFPYISLLLELKTGVARQFDDVSAAEKARASVDAIVDAVNGRIPPPEA